MSGIGDKALLLVEQLVDLQQQTIERRADRFQLTRQRSQQRCIDPADIFQQGRQRQHAEVPLLLAGGVGPIQAVATVNQGRDIAAFKRLAATGKSLDEAALCNSSTPLRSLL
ncbi:oxidoreductase C-terminal domain-containing protein [Pseudomonas cavernae]|uniref:oxidoreductase C-terminal domain-containing protein n=1 Tax=Pseudomonas cavernae TaxID=2320867 RepID=UPI003B75BA8B